jgi:hydroxysqualene dehydroxylase
MHSFEKDTVHVVGAGLAGLAAAAQLCGDGRTVIVHEATAHAGGRCRSYFDQATGMMIDNGTHIVLSGNHAALAFLKTIGAQGKLRGPDAAEFQFVDLKTDERWQVRLNDGRIPWWIFNKHRRVPDTTAAEYLSLAKLPLISADVPLETKIKCEGVLYERLLAPLLLAALNIAPPLGSSRLAAAVVRETLASGGKACRPLLAPEGIGAAFIEPAVAFLRDRGVKIHFQSELREMCFEEGEATVLNFADRSVTLRPCDCVVLAVPPQAAAKLVPGLEVPTAFRSILNAHFRIDAPSRFPSMLGVINGTVEWLFAFPGRMSATVSDASHLLDMPRPALAETIWNEIAQVTHLPPTLPPWHIVRERRATFAATPSENARRPNVSTRWRNLFLAGDWTATGLPATIEGAIRSGNRAAQLIKRSQLAAAV